MVQITPVGVDRFVILHRAGRQHPVNGTVLVGKTGFIPSLRRPGVISRPKAILNFQGAASPGATLMREPARSDGGRKSLAFFWTSIMTKADRIKPVAKPAKKDYTYIWSTNVYN
jgi:hypothetical protein